MSARPRTGIIHNAGTPGSNVYLPLEEVRIDAMILDVSARVSVTHRYFNPSEMSTSRAKYLFPVPASAALCGFEMQLGDGRTLVGVSKSNEVAQDEFAQAMANQTSAALMEYITDDIFTISVGAIPALTYVETKTTYVEHLLNDDNTDEIRFALPMSVAERYGDAPAGIVDAVSATSQTRVRIIIEVQTSGRMREITSPSHPDEISETRRSTRLNRPSRRRSTVKWRSSSFLERDFILVINAADLDAPRCFAELLEQGRARSLALQLTLIPKFNMPPIPDQEYLFLIDRSGSMGGPPIETAKETLVILLRQLPAVNTTFNIFSFGTDVKGQWLRSRAYTDDSLGEATQLVDSMDANFGVTEVCKALQAVFGSRRCDRPTTVFVLTDGKSTDIAATTHLVLEKTASSPREAPLRVFVLGIGNQVSTAMCEGIARAGNGVALFAAENESIIGRCSRLFRAGQSVVVENVAVDWGLEDDQLAQTTTTAFSDPALTPGSVVLRPFPSIQQTPTDLSNLHAGTRIGIFGIVHLSTSFVPKEVTLRGKFEHMVEDFELVVPVQEVHVRPQGRGPKLPLVHTLAAWKLIQEHQEGTAPLPQVIGTATPDDIRKATIIRLGEKYQLTSRHTSFIVVDEARYHDIPHHSSSRSRSPVNTLDNQDSHAWDNDSSSGSVGWGSFILSWLSGFLPSVTGYTPVRTLPGAWMDEGMPNPQRNSSQTALDEDARSVHSFSTMSSLIPSSEFSDRSRSPSPQRESEEEARVRQSSSPRIGRPRDLPGGTNDDSQTQTVRPRRSDKPLPRIPPLDHVAMRLIRLQRVDGSLRRSDELIGIIGERVANELGSMGLADDVWATVAFVARLRRGRGNATELVNDLVIKSMEYLRGQNIDIEAIITRADELLAT